MKAFINAKAELTRRIRAIQPEHGARSSTSAALKISSQLPKIPLPTFTGNQTDWETFKAKFSSLVKDTPQYSNTTKLHYLLSCLGGDGARRLNNIEVVDENFVGAWDTLIQHYNNKRVRLSAHMRRIITMPAATSKFISELIQCKMLSRKQYAP